MSRADRRAMSRMRWVPAYKPIWTIRSVYDRPGTQVSDSLESFGVLYDVHNV
ncbi:hypothetical protein PUNSTDRAFT_51814 [Punctularia strigosozonata HHB-11173 SS5]|uniref:uncharacterized protein n=1 Tax=Punctularia strigosozonata (strain HHB-11173) TaxID=741275 RepID=UPI000441770F|nr:uncharacterized protein PUNSTDRAFT_51814 [Punctularia strigosozonata HHB-11173 SS5]EIN09584.1 hypothetical protein PUNSTDRAFT_51814 [Punctularia strigosozonata HHB-11173 SS5]